MNKTEHKRWLLYCRPGFEPDCAQEALRQAKRQKPLAGITQADMIEGSGYVVIPLNGQILSWRELIFARQVIRVHHVIDALPERDRLTPILDAVASLPGTFGTLWLEVPDTNDGKTLSGFIKRFRPLLEENLRAAGRLADDRKLPRLHIFFPDKNQ